jgi:cytochrome P450
MGVDADTRPILSHDWGASELFPDPHPLLHKLRATTPVYFDTTLDAWVLTSHPVVREALRHPQLGRVEQLKRFERLPDADQEALQVLRRIFPTWGAQGDPVAHEQFVNVARRRMDAARIEVMRPRVQATLDQLLDRVAGREKFDLANEVAKPFTMQVAGDLVGVPTTRMDLLLRCAQDVPELFERGTREQLYRSQRCVLELCDLIRPVVAQHHVEPRDDLISLLIGDGRQFDDEFVAAQAIMFLMVGARPPGNLLSSGLLLLMEHPKEKAKLLADPGLVGNAVDEMVRVIPPVPPFATREVAKADMRLGDQLIREGESLVLVIGAANRDPKVFPDPDRFDVTRPDLAQHLGFGIPPFSCFGRALVHLEAAVFFPTVLERLPDLRPLDAVPDWVPFYPFARELRTLRVAHHKEA